MCQAAVDRGVYRSKYDAGQTLEAFSARLQQDVDLDAMTAELLAIVHQTLQPSQAKLWLRRRGKALVDTTVSAAHAATGDGILVVEEDRGAGARGSAMRAMERRRCCWGISGDD